VASRLATLARGAAARADAAAGGPWPEPQEAATSAASRSSPGTATWSTSPSRRILCACRACTILFDRPGAGGGHLKLLPTRRRRLDGFRLDDAAWERLRIPVDMAFFFAARRPSACSPSTRARWARRSRCSSSRRGRSWRRPTPELAEMEADVEALLVSRARGMHEHWLVPIDDCYELVGLIRSRWKGLAGGEEVWEAIDRFFDDLATREERR
jgi:hypothetical protein